MKKVFSICLFVLSTCFFGQTHKAENFRNSIGDFKTSGAWLPGAKIDNSIEGTTYLFSEWEALNQVFVDKEQYFSIQNLNYNIKTNQLESKISKDSVFQYDCKKIMFIKHNNAKYRFCKIKENLELCQDFFSTPKICFVKGYSIDLINELVNPMTQVRSNAKYIIKEKFYCKLVNPNFVEVKLKKSVILKLLGDKSSMVEKYASDTKLSFSNEKDLISIFRYYDSL